MIVTGAQPDHVELDYFESRLTPALRKRVMQIADLDLPRLVAELSLVDGFVSSSTGPLHIAAVVSGNAVGLYSDAFYQHPRRWGPIGPAGNVLISPWTFSEPPLIRSPLAGQHMAQITVEQVFDRMLNPPARASGLKRAGRHEPTRPAATSPSCATIGSATWSARSGLRGLRLGYPQAHLTAIVSSETADLLAHHPHVDAVLAANKRTPTRELARLLKAGRFDAILAVHCTGRNALAALLARIPVRVTHGRPLVSGLVRHASFLSIASLAADARSRFLPEIHSTPGHPFTPPRPIRSSMSIRPSVPSCRPALPPPSALKDAVRGPSGQSCHAYNWPQNHYLETINRLARLGRVIVTGSPYDRAAIDAITGRIDPAMRSRVTTFTNLSIAQLVATLSLVESYLASSTGPLHIAAIVSGRAVGLYCDVAYQHPNRWSPIGAAMHRDHDPLPGQRGRRRLAHPSRKR